jgi:hypothetical protein
MNEESRAAPAGGTSSPPFMIEAHYYEGGLRVTPVAVASRPEWVPTADLVGFRGEFPIGPDEPVVEFARYAVQNRHVTWIGVFHKSVDRVFGDRHNNAGIGIWLAEGIVVAPRLLLEGLRQFSRALARGEVEAALDHAAKFAGEEYLPKYLSDARSFPPAFGGWGYSASAMPETALFLARGKDADEAWIRAADQLLRMSVLPDPVGNRARTLILVTTAALADERASMLNLVKPDPVAELLSRLPEATASVAQDNAGLRREVERLAATLAQVETERTEALSARAAAEQRLAEMEAPLDEDELLRRLPAIEEKLERMETDMRGIGNSVMRFYAEWGNWRATTQNTGGYGGRVSAPSPRSVHLESPRTHSGEDRRAGLIGLLYGVAAVVAIALAGFLIYFFASRDEPQAKQLAAEPSVEAPEPVRTPEETTGASSSPASVPMLNRIGGERVGADELPSDDPFDRKDR